MMIWIHIGPRREVMEKGMPPLRKMVEMQRREEMKSLQHEKMIICLADICWEGIMMGLREF